MKDNQTPEFRWISFEEQTPPIKNSEGEVNMLCLLDDGMITSIYHATCVTAAYREAHPDKFRGYTHWLILPKRPSAIADVDPHAECPLCNPELRDENWEDPMKKLFGSEEGDSA